MLNRNKSKKIFLLYSLIGFGFLIFLSVMLSIALNNRHLPSLYTQDSSKAQRGSIISADGFHIATTKKLYKAVVNTYYIDPQKKDLFIELFSIYSGMSPKTIRKKLNSRKGSVVLSYHIPQIRAQYLKQLAYELRTYKVFIERKNPKTGHRTLQGLNIIESGESREYPYNDLMTPIMGYTHKAEEDGYTKARGIKGIEKRFENELEARQDGKRKGPRDVNGYIILNKDSFTKPNIDGLDIKLTIPVGLQIRMERMLSKMKKKLRAKQVMLAVMETKSGKVITLASSNRFKPKAIKKRDYPSLNSGMTEYSFEPGSVIKTIVFALLLEKKLVNPYDLINGYNGRFKIGKKVITDEHKFDWLSAENVIVHSSNIGIAQLAQKLSGTDFHQGLKEFGFAQKSTNDLIYERFGSIPSIKRLNNEIYKATCSYGYGMRANLMQLIRAYSAFNNNGRMVYPRLVDSFIDEYNRKIPIPKEKSIRAIKSSTAQRIKEILIKTVKEGTGKNTNLEGLQIGGKTGTAHIVKNRRYVNSYNTSFIGFANDKTKKYTIGAVVVEPEQSHFASQTAVVVFKKAIEIMVEEGYLTPNIVK